MRTRTGRRQARTGPGSAALLVMAMLAWPAAGAEVAPGAATPPAPPPATAYATELDEILVRGELPGPAMWRVSKDGHSLWIMGTLSLMPRRMTWRQQKAEEVIRSSGEILGESTADWDMDLGLREAFGMLRQVMRLRHNADGATLREVLPAPVYERWHAAHRRWFGKDPSPRERARPLYAGYLLYERALHRSGLTEEPVVWTTAERIARRHGVKVRERAFRIKVKEPRGILVEMEKLPADKEAACLVAYMDYIDHALPDMQRRARAWASGDLATLRALPPEEEAPECVELIEGTRVAALVDQEEALFREDWSGIVDWLLLTHETSFTTLPIEKLFEPDGVLADLRRKGYTVEEPQ